VELGSMRLATKGKRMRKTLYRCYALAVRTNGTQNNATIVGCAAPASRESLPSNKPGGDTATELMAFLDWAVRTWHVGIQQSRVNDVVLVSRLHQWCKYLPVKVTLTGQFTRADGNSSPQRDSVPADQAAAQVNTSRCFTMLSRMEPWLSQPASAGTHTMPGRVPGKADSEITRRTRGSSGWYPSMDHLAAALQ
jgi:hypothetical protein